MWLLSEDSALKYKLQGLTVTDQTSASLPDGVRQVPVRFQLPMDELTNLTFPIILIKFSSMTWANDRQSSGTVMLPYAPEGMKPWWPPGATSYPFSGSPYQSQTPLAVYLFYQVTLYSRLQRDHQRPLEAALSQPDYLPLLDGYLNIPQDGTFRRLDVMGGPVRGYAHYDAGELGEGDQKRLLYTTWQIRVSSEMLYPVIDLNDVSLVKQINIDLTSYASVADISIGEINEMVGILSVGPQVNWNTLSLQEPAPPEGE